MSGVIIHCIHYIIKVLLLFLKALLKMKSLHFNSFVLIIQINKILIRMKSKLKPQYNLSQLANVSKNIRIPSEQIQFASRFTKINVKIIPS